MNRFEEKDESACKEGLVWACLIHWTINNIVGKTILLFNKVHSQTKMGKVKCIWHAYFGLLGESNDLNVLDRSPLIWDLLGGVHALTSILK
jgi:hypothetical protein